MYQIILASASPRRKDILNQIGTEFTVVTSELEEFMTKEAPPILVRRLSAGKAEEVLTRIHFGQEKKKRAFPDIYIQSIQMLLLLELIRLWLLTDIF